MQLEARAAVYTERREKAGIVNEADRRIQALEEQLRSERVRSQNLSEKMEAQERRLSRPPTPQTPKQNGTDYKPPTEIQRELIPTITKLVDEVRFLREKVDGLEKAR